MSITINDIDLLTSIGGVGKPSAASFLTELGDIDNFATSQIIPYQIRQQANLLYN